MVRAYVNDICQFLDITNKENVKILKEKALIWALDLLLIDDKISVNPVL